MHGWETGFEVHTLSELTSHGSGLGVSSSIAVSLTACFRQMKMLREGGCAETPHDIARDAWTVEIDRLRRPIGRQDHVAAAYGGFRLYRFEKDDVSVEQSFTFDDASWVTDHLLVVQLPEGHDSRAILSGVKSLEALEMAASAVEVAIKAVIGRSVKRLGDALLLGQASKRGIGGAVPQWLSKIVDTITRCSGVYGCKVAGAGGGGHLVVVCEPSARQEIELASQLPVMTIQPDMTGVRSDGYV
jgi:D-glycero-alpha-D-manno-heptose-7-phosphate kinase